MCVRSTPLLLGAMAFAFFSCTQYPAPQTSKERFAPEVADTSAASLAFREALRHKRGGRYDAALAHMTPACAKYKVDENWPDYVRCSAQMGMCALELGRFDSSATHLEEALKIGRRHLGERHPLVGGVHNQMGRLHTARSQYDHAFAAYREALDILLASLDEQDLFVAETYHNLATAYRITGDFQLASSYFEKALHVRLAHLGEVHPDVAKTYNGLGALHAHLGNYDVALATLHKALQINESVLGRRHPDIVPILGNIGGTFQLQGKYDAAFDILYEALDIAQAAHGERHPSVASILAELGIVYAENGEYDLAESFYDQAIQISRQLHGVRHKDVAVMYSKLGAIYTIRGEYKKALELLESAYEISISLFGRIHPTVAINLQRIGTTHRLEGNYEQAEYALKDGLDVALEILGEDHPTVASILNDIGIVYVVNGRPERAISNYNQSLKIFKAMHGNGHRSVATSYNNLGNAYRAIGDYDRALDMLYSARRINVAILGTDDPRVATNLNNLGRVYLDIGEYETAHGYFEQALDLFLRAYGEVHPYVANQYNALGSVTAILGEPERSLDHYEKALSIFRSTSGENDPYVARGYNALGTTYAALGDQEQAHNYLHRALRHRISGFGQIHPQVAKTYNDIGELYRNSGSFDRALDSFEHALCANAVNRDCNELSESPVRGLSEQDWLISLWGMARVLSSLAERQVYGISGLEAAVKVYKQASGSIDRIRRNVRTDGSKLYLAELGAPLLADAVDAAVQLYEATGDARHKAAAFYFAEKGKATLLLEAFSETRARKIAGIPDSLLEQERWILAEITAHEQRLRELLISVEPEGSTERSRREGQVFDLKRRREALIGHLENAYPDYFHLKYNVDVATPEEVRVAGLDKRTALIEYVIHEHDIFIFTLTSDATDVTVVPKDSLLDTHVSLLRRGIVEQDYQLYTTNAYALYRQLLEPVIQKLYVKNLIIVPHGVLNYVPFEALLTKETAGTSDVKDYRSLSYLIQQYAISYSYSATLLVETRQRRRPPPPRDYIAFAPVFASGIPIGSRGSDLIELNDGRDTADLTHVQRGYLPRTRVEVTGIQRLFLNRYGFFERFVARKARVYLEEDASEARLKTSPLDEYRYVHFATHGFANQTSPEASGIVLFPEVMPERRVSKTARNEEDGVLRLSEVYNLRLNADLVVLSACETGIGPIARGEGILSLTRGFLFAGASNVLVSLWKADDIKTGEIMPNFYKNVLEDGKKASALRKAKLAVIQGNPRYARPFYWAPFVLVGK